MTPREKDTKIAEWCEPKPSRTYGFDECFLTPNPPRSPLGFWRCVCIYDHGDEPEWVPEQFSSNLNAMAQAEALLPERGLEEEYIEHLRTIARIRIERPMVHYVTPEFAFATATAPQRATALCRMIVSAGK